MEKEPRLKFAQVSLLNTKSLSLNTAERTPSALYCRDIQDISAPINCYFLDSSGYIFSEAPAFSGGVYFVYSSDPNLEVPLRAQYLESKKFVQIDAFIKSLADIGLYPKVMHRAPILIVSRVFYKLVINRSIQCFC